MRVHEPDGILCSQFATLLYVFNLYMMNSIGKLFRNLEYVFLLNEKAEYSNRLDGKIPN